MTRVVLASTNVGKLLELRRILADTGVELVDASCLDLPDVEETADTFEGNAVLKARSAASSSGLIALGDDSGLAVDALGGDPGVRSARWAGPQRDDDANRDLVLAQTAGATDRGARFVCAAALAHPDGRAWTIRGTLEGDLIEEARGDGGFGYDPILVPVGQTRTCAELSPEEKDALSHRGAAFRAMAPALAALVAGRDPGAVGAHPHQ